MSKVCVDRTVIARSGRPNVVRDHLFDLQKWLTELGLHCLHSSNHILFNQILLLKNTVLSSISHPVIENESTCNSVYTRVDGKRFEGSGKNEQKMKRRSDGF
ncbi:unnamed protein product [Albugo candida]|uniref:Uncharacterized protein n=1 Tax=Albugo candida TaxID=65357 RepID=A0A024FT04_9STRA|nr:unnamed protein product [Albugo candida]|eukprot:CCI10096.1 unnamed protein product [Albugo candida]